MFTTFIQIYLTYITRILDAVTRPHMIWYHHHQSVKQDVEEFTEYIPTVYYTDLCSNPHEVLCTFQKWANKNILWYKKSPSKISLVRQEKSKILASYILFTFDHKKTHVPFWKISHIKLFQKKWPFSFLSQHLTNKHNNSVKNVNDIKPTKSTSPFVPRCCLTKQGKPVQ